MNCRNRQYGFTLVEILVTLTISLFLVGGILQIFLNNKQTYRAQEGLSRIQENGRSAIDVLGSNIRQAGYAAISTNTASRYTKFTDGAGTVITGTEGTGTGIMSINGISTNGATDSITVSFDSPTDCLGSATPVPGVAVPGGNVQRAVNWFFIDANNNLACLGNGNAVLGNGNAVPQPLIEGVENMQIWYGLDTDGDQAANTYVTAPAAWNNVVSVRICLLLRSIEDRLVDQPITYQDCNGNQTTATDRRLRRSFISTFNLRNRINNSPAF